MHALVDVPDDLAPARPFLTVALTTYNRCELLAGAIECVLKQSFTNYELLIIDDASFDDTEQVVKRYITENPHPIRYFRQPTNSGISAARNEAIKHAHSDFIVYLDDDDRFSPDFLGHVAHALENAPATLTFVLPGRYSLRSSSTGDILLGQSSFRQLKETQLLPGMAYFDWPFGGGTGLVVRRSAAQAVGGWETGLSHGEDRDFMMRLALHGDFMTLPDARIMLYSHDRPQLTKEYAEAARADERLADRYAVTLRSYPATHARYYVKGARAFYALKMRQEGRRCMGKALRATPFSWRTWRRLLLFELSDFLPLAKRRQLFHDYRHGYIMAK